MNKKTFPFQAVNTKQLATQPNELHGILFLQHQIINNTEEKAKCMPGKPSRPLYTCKNLINNDTFHCNCNRALSPRVVTKYIGFSSFSWTNTHGRERGMRKKEEIGDVRGEKEQGKNWGRARMKWMDRWIAQRNM